MKKIQRNLKLRADTIRVLTAVEIRGVNGGITSYELCDSQNKTDCFTRCACP